MKLDRRLVLLPALALAAACGDDVRADPDSSVLPDASMMDDAGPATLEDGAPVAFATTYDAEMYTAGGANRMWYPVDLSVHPAGELWVIQRMERSGEFDDDTECTERGLVGAPNDCVSLQGSTVAIDSPASAEPASGSNGRANVIVDPNAWHFMRRPSGIAFGAEELRLGPGDEGAAGADLAAELVMRDTFATCHEHWTGNPTDNAPFIGPSLWSADPSIYGTMGSFDWSNGSHLDMVHATEYCMGIAYEGGNVYWLFNGDLGALDRYDFVQPHHPGHFYHDDAIVTRHHLPVEDPLVRLPTVPSNMVIEGDALYVADTGNGRVLRFDMGMTGNPGGNFQTQEGIVGTNVFDIGYREFATSATLEAEWGGASEPSGLTVLDNGTVIVANHATGHLTLLDSEGAVLRTIDTETGTGIGGMTDIDGDVYFAQIEQRRVVRMSVAP